MEIIILLEELHGGGSSAQIQLGGGNLTINLPPAINGSFAGKITGTGSFIKTGTGHQSLSNSTHDYSGTTTINRWDD